MHRRAFLKTGAATLTAAAVPAFLPAQVPPLTAPTFHTDDAAWQAAYDKALLILAGNVQTLPRFPQPVLIEGAEYAGIWQECGPMESLVYRHFRPDVARNGHMVFFALQRPDGQLPANNKRSETGFGQIQMVVPIAATAWDLAHATGDSELLEAAYSACSRWDEWLVRYRNTRGTGLVEGFCTYDTGMDNSPRWAGIPPQCPGKDAKRFPPIPTLPRLCPDLSATVYGARVALASMASALGKPDDAAHWQERAETLRQLILSSLYVPEEAAFYDLDAQDHFVRVRSIVLARVCGEHVVDQPTFEHLWTKQLGNPRAFWPQYPLPSIALDDPAFVRPIKRNSWGGPSQALTALRAGRWMDHYGSSAEFAHLMQRWCEDLQRDSTFRQQVDPVSGAFTDGDLPGYSPAALVMYDFTWRLAGVYEDADTLQWNVRPGSPAAANARFSLPTRKGDATLRYTKQGAQVSLGGKQIAELHGVARLTTDPQGKPLSLLGITDSPQHVALHLGGQAPRNVTLQPNERVTLQA